MSDQVLARLAALKTAPTSDLKNQWRELFETEPPPFKWHPPAERGSRRTFPKSEPASDAAAVVSVGIAECREHPGFLERNDDAQKDRERTEQGQQRPD